MKLITRNTDYAVRAISFIAKSMDKIIPVTALVKELKIPKPFLRKILQILHKEKILRACKGYGGGFTLALSPDEIFLADLVRIFQGPLSLNKCIFRKKICPNRKICALKREIDAIEEGVLRRLETLTIASLLRRSA